MEGLRFQKLNEYQTLVTSENHQIVLTNMVTKYSRFLSRAKINAVVSIILSVVSAIFTIVFVKRAFSPFAGVIEAALTVGAICITILSLTIFNSSTWDIHRFQTFINQYER